MTEQKYVVIEVGELLHKVQEFSEAGYRLVQVSCTGSKDYELLYSFDQDLNLVSLRLQVQKDTEIPSISKVYWAAFIYENEIHDLFGLTIKDIGIDYNGTLYKTAVKTPFAAE